MNLPASLFSSDWLWLANFVFGFYLFRAVRGGQWRALLKNATMVNALVGLTVGAFVLWQFNAGIRPGFNFHIIGSTLFYLMFGWEIGSVMLTLIMLATWLRTGIDLITLGMNGLLMITVPVLFSDWLLKVSKRNFPKNLFFYVLFNGFICAALGILLNTFVTTLLLLGLSHYTWPIIQHHFLVAIPIIMLTEAFATGVMITAFTVFQPEAVLNFSDEDYINGK